eukprot:g29198.t1
MLLSRCGLRVGWLLSLCLPPITSECTPDGQDPWATGEEVACCSGLHSCRLPWLTQFHCSTAPCPCTPEGTDPFVSGTEISCCPELNRCLSDWLGDGRYSYLCTSATCPGLGGKSATTSRPKPVCTSESGDPFASGAELPCCPGLIKCLSDWLGDGNWQYKCQWDCPDIADGPACTGEGGDPQGKEENVPCCTGLVSCFLSRGKTEGDQGQEKDRFQCLAACPSLPSSTDSTTSTARPASTDTDTEEWTLIWADEFDAPSLDRSKWEVEVNCWGGGNHEAQCYRDSPANVYVQDGMLHLRPIYHPQGYTGVSLAEGCTLNNENSCRWTKKFTSARIRSLANVDKGSWLYGKIEARLQLPKGDFLWPAFWMLPTDQAYGTWAASGEIDIMEYRGQEANLYSSALHFSGEWPLNTHITSGATDTGVDLSQDHHTFSLHWRPDMMDFSLDGQVKWSVSLNRSFWDGRGHDPYAGADRKPFDQRFHILLNNAVAGGFFPVEKYGEFDPARANASWAAPAFKVDWVRVYAQPEQDDNNNILRTELSTAEPAGPSQSDKSFGTPAANQQRRPLVTHPQTFLLWVLFCLTSCSLLLSYRLLRQRCRKKFQGGHAWQRLQPTTAQESVFAPHSVSDSEHSDTEEATAADEQT